MHLTFDDILKNTIRLPFSSEDMTACELLLSINKENGLDLVLRNGITLESMIEDGVVQLDSLLLNSQFCFVNLPADRYVFDGPQFKVIKYISTLNEDSYQEVSIKSKLLTNLISINDQFRLLGLLKK